MTHINKFNRCLLYLVAFMAFSLPMVAQTYTGAGNPKPIPATGTGGFPCVGGPTTSIATVPLMGTIGTNYFIQSVNINLTHTWDSDLEISLIAPSGTTWDLSSDNGGSGDNFTNTVFQDGAPSITGGAAPFTGTFEAEQGPFALGFAGQAVNGSWTLSICDDAGGDSGTLLSYSITFGVPCQIVPPADITVNTALNQCYANVTLPLAVGVGCADPITNDYTGGGANASGQYPLGSTTVTYSAGIAAMAQTTVTVVDNQAPIFTNCPNDMTITLDPGDCEFIFNYDITATDNCPLLGAPVNITKNNQFTVASINNSVACPGGGYQTMQAYNLTALGYPSKLFISGVQFGLFQVLGTPTVTANVYSIANIPAPPAALNYANMTLIGTGSTVLAAGGAGIGSITLNTPVTVTGGNIVVEIVTPGSLANGFIPGYNSAGLTSGTTYLASTFCGVTQPTPVNSIVAGVGEFMLQLNANQQLLPTRVNGPVSGTALAGGTTTNYLFTITDGAGRTSTCDFDVTVRKYPTPTNSMNCNDLVQVSLDPDCQAIVGADDILEGGPYRCYNDYIVKLYYNAALTQLVPTSPAVTSANIGQTLWAKVIDPFTNNSCWGKITVEDKHIPSLTCTSLEVDCADNITPGSRVTGILNRTVNPATAIVDNGTLNIPFNVSGAPTGSTIEDLNISLNISHTWVGDLVITLTSPAGTAVQLVNNIGGPGFGCAGNDLVLTLDDEATATYATLNATCNNAPAVSGTFHPLNPLSVFDGQNANGNWRLTVQDLALGDGGTVNQISLDITLPGLNVIPFPVPATATVTQTTAQQGTPNYTVRNFDGCGNAILSYSDWIQDIDCLLNPTSPYTKIIYRTWTATDLHGNSTQCKDTLSLIRATLVDLVTPPNYDDQDQPALLCNQKEPTPPNANCGAVVGWNAINSGPYAGHPSPDNELYPCGNVKWFGTGVPGGISCGNINYTFQDIRINVCQNGSSEGCYKVVRRWSILDWCNGDFLTYTQFIKVADKEGPTISDIVDATISVAAWECEATYYVPEPWIMDNCSDINGVYTVTTTKGKIAYLPAIGRYVITELPIGVFQLKVRALDCCGNATEVTANISVEDLVPPYVTCEVYRTTSVTTDGTSKIFANSFDDGSYDACGPVYFKVIRMEDLLGTDDGSNSNQSTTTCDGINGDDNTTRAGNQIYFDDYVKYCCEDIGVAGLQAKLRVFDVDPGTGPVNPNRMRPGGDLYGHYNDCWSNVAVEDKLAPFISCPNDITVSCDFWFDMNNLGSTFGTVRNNIADVQYIIINDRYCNANPNDPNHMGSTLFDPNNPTKTFAKNVGRDGVANDNCSVLITENMVDNLVCGQGTITRIFTATDPNGRTASCVQRITIVDCDPYFITDVNCFNVNSRDGVRWPCDYNASTCGAATSPSVAGQPQIFNDDNCALIAVTYDDEPFPIVPDACFKIKRIWTITDWCHYDPFDSDANGVYDPTDDGVIAGQWEYVQYIKVLNSTNPVFGACTNIDICGYNADCTAAAALANTVSDDCTPGDLLIVDFKIDINNDGTYDFIGSNKNPYPYPNPNGLPILSVSYSDANGDGIYDVRIANRNYPIGTHRILWSAEDVCSNVGTCSYLFTTKDCAKPTPKAFHGLAVDIQPVNNRVCVTAMMMNAGSFDNCGVQQLRIGPAKGPGQTVPPTTTEVCFDCNNLGTNNVDLWVQDVNGNWDYVATYIQVQNNMGACNGPLANITGGIDNEQGASVAGVNVALTGNAPNMPDVQITGVGGTYSFTNMPRSNNYEVVPSKNDDYRNGISTLDIVLLSRHLIGLQRLNSPYKIIAADVDHSNSVNTFDIIALQKLILYISTGFSNNTSWRFIEGAYTFSNPNNPWSSPFPEVCAFNGLTDQNIADFVAVKIGDLNGNAQTNGVSQGGDRSFHGDVNFQIDNATLVAGEEYTVDFKASPEGSGFTKLAGYQFTLSLDQKAVDFVDVQAGELSGLSSANFGLAMIDEGVITTSWSSKTVERLSDDAIVFSVKLKAKQNVSLSEVMSLNSRYTVAEAYNENLELMNIGLKFNTGEVVSNEFALYQNQPNPFQEETVIGFNLPEAGAVTLSIYDVSGKVLKVINGDFAKGYNQVSVTRNELAASGVLYYQVETANDSATMKMIIVE